MERTPFDGCVFHANYRTPTGETGNFTWKAWGRRAFTRYDLAAALSDLRATRRRRFTHLLLRVNVTPGDVDWFDDFTPVLENLRLAAEVARLGGCRGLLLDTESYEKPLFEYRQQRYVGAVAPEEYAAQVRRRGREAIAAIESGFPRADVLFTFGHELTWRLSDSGARPSWDSRYGLLAPLVDGLVEGRRTARLVHGYEMSYGFKTAPQFQEAYAAARTDPPPLVIDRERHRRVVSVGFGLWMDYQWRTHGWDEATPDRNYFAPAAFEASLRAAWQATDEYVWIYTEQPRWWTEEGKPVRLPPAYDEAIRRVRGTR